MTATTARCLIRELDELFVEAVVDPDGGRVYRPFGREVEPDESPEDFEKYGEMLRPTGLLADL
ncbi:hypothetical protein [Halobacterium noricense]|uniref:hypothetical protein n=1 Tax=Halobacterium noricense TaxID=223182 RepID=UPI001E459975|nr:hypothetical protein [Halobacterium noricense]UHH25930.1 hypothetical protein LT974_03085 [Halobacterium noricense]